ncbi:hypothetical protein, unknown function [Leishmania tarentolae]|uniref:Uncharacterized protein n=1 Tax=Leishmania tarentolae TaxID=5689 RepID=A0A640KDB1_LEITA|nr:hypothetical protein, unknown function [Leishmania tarentolae]
MCVGCIANMYARSSPGTKTVGDVLGISASDMLRDTKQPRCGSVRLLPHKPPAFLQKPLQRSTAQADKSHRGATRPRRNRSAGSGTSRRPLDEALFCALRMESQADVLRRLRAHGKATLIEDFRTLCRSISLQNIRAEDFTFLCTAVLQCDLKPLDCEVVFAYLRAERTSCGGISVPHLLERLGTLFEPIEVACALQLKCFLETRTLDSCTVSLNELERAEAGLRSLLVDESFIVEVGPQWEKLEDELQRLQVQFAVPVPTFRLLVRRSARALQSAVRALGWDGKIQRPLWQEEHDVANDDAAQEPLSAFQVGRLSTCTLHRIDNEGDLHDRSTVVLSAVTKLYHHRLALGAHSLVAAEPLGTALGKTVQAATGVSSLRSRNSEADPTHPRFTADLYAIVSDAASCTETRSEAYTAD